VRADAGHLVVEAVAGRVERDPAMLGSLNRALRGDLETIVFKAMAKEKEQRYASSAQLAVEKLDTCARVDPSPSCD
jgi:hypothetical protein